MFPYNTFIDLSSGDQTLEDYVSRCRAYAVWYDDSADVSGGKILTLSTCDYTYENGRLVIIAVRDCHKW